MKKVLLTNNEISQYTGSELNCITLAKRFKQYNYEVYIGALKFTNPLMADIKDEEFKYIDLLDVNLDISNMEFDIIWSQHTILLDWLIFEKNVKAKKIVASSLSSKEFFERLPIYSEDLNLILANSIETKEIIEEKEEIKNIQLFENYSFEDYFNQEKQINQLKNIAIVSNHLASEIKEAIPLIENKGYHIDVYGIEGKKVLIDDTVLNNYDAVVTIGKTVQFAMSLNIPVYVYDIHGGAGYLRLNNLEQNRSKNFSGRSFNKKDANQIAQEIVEEYDNVIPELNKIKKYAYDNFCFEKIFDKYLNYLENDNEINLEKLKEKYKKHYRNIMLSRHVTNYIAGIYNDMHKDSDLNIQKLNSEINRLNEELRKKEKRIREVETENQILINKQIQTIDVLLATYNGEKYLRQQLDSILGQTYANIRLIISDDASTDGTVEILKEYAQNDKRIELFLHEQNMGSLNNFEFLLSKVENEVYALSDQDDVWNLNKLELTYNKMIQTDADLVFSDLEVVNNKLEQILPSFNDYMKLTRKINKYCHDYRLQYLYNCITGCTLMSRKKFLNQILPLPTDSKYVIHDSWIGLIVALNGKVEYLNEKTIKYRQHENNQIGTDKISHQFKKLEQVRDLFIDVKIQLFTTYVNNDSCFSKELVVQNNKALKYFKMINNKKWLNFKKWSIFFKLYKTETALNIIENFMIFNFPILVKPIFALRYKILKLAGKRK